ncbi:MAG TPA: flagellar hook capping FlgD N-terminal domain-containing protein [Ramlibacter sp.]|nr:flagellar hook capping FlgD N-terminal domain-containing protein [Ramlibacter sp.]
MAIEAIASAGNAATAVGLQDFLRILLTQLSYQDPLKPMDNQQFMAQMAQFTALEQTQRMNEQLGRLVLNQASLQSVGLLGRSVEVSEGDGTVQGVVASLSLHGDAPLVTVTTTAGATFKDLPLGRLRTVR